MTADLAQKTPAYTKAMLIGYVLSGLSTFHFTRLNICYGGKYEDKSNKWTLFSICCGLISG